ncbi:hypothetical protein E5D57_013644 [Metarhizium anisopliae]|nr:hypothetical protein E5D57_013644 [Metarhizium anisopliae]
MERMQALLHEAQLRSEAAERRFNEERRQREAAEQRAQASEQQTQPTTFSEYLDACHRLVFAELQVEHNPDRLSRGSLTNPQSKRCPTTLRQ